MRDYGRITPEFWTGETGRALQAKGLEAVVVAAYLMTSPHANMIGLYRLPISYLSEDTGTPFEGASKGLRSCSEVGFCAYDEPTQYVFVYEFARYQTAETLTPKDNRHKAIANVIRGMRNCPFLQDFFAIYAEDYQLPPALLDEGASKGLRRGFEASKQEAVNSKQVKALQQGDGSVSEDSRRAAA